MQRNTNVYTKEKGTTYELEQPEQNVRQHKQKSAGEKEDRGCTIMLGQSVA